MMQFRLMSVLALAIVGLAGCSSNTAFSVDAVGCPDISVEASEYKIGSGDELNIVVWRNEELSATIPVRPDGKISMPLVDDMEASGKTPSELSTDIEEVLAEYLRTPEVSVIVVSQGAANQVQVVGEVTAPQSIPYRDGLRLLDVLVAVGGVTDFAAPNRTRVVRQTGQGQYECRVRLGNVLSGDMRDNIAIFPGDVLVVPETRF